MQETIEENQKFALWKPQYKRNRASRGEKIILTEAEKYTSDDKKICKIFNDLFSNVVSGLKIPDYCKYFPQKNTCLSRLSLIEKHPSILNIKKRKLDTVFSFRKTTQERRGIKSYPGFNR